MPLLIIIIVQVSQVGDVLKTVAQCVKVYNVVPL